MTGERSEGKKWSTNRMQKGQPLSRDGAVLL